VPLVVCNLHQRRIFMKVYIFIDMEGISGVSSSEFVSATGRHYALGRRYYTDDLNACVRGCFAGGADAVLARDGHGSGDHCLWAELDPRVELVQGPTGTTRMVGLEECDALILLGYHAMAGTPQALLEHTYSSASIQNMWLNGRRAGELAFDSAIAGEQGVPTILVSGDDAVCREAREWLPGVLTCQVKQGLNCQAARLMPREAAHRLIEEKSAEAVRKALAGETEPFTVERPVTIRREMMERKGIPAAGSQPHLRILDGRTYEVTADTVEKAFFGLC
jgi:D-amino peptidase